MEQTWRWFGPDDYVKLAHIRQAGATGVVTALHHIPYGVVWSVEEIEKRKAEIAADASLGLAWTVVESLPVSEAIKLGDGDLEPLYENYRQSIRNLAACGIKTICYNFMPVLDWTRTDLTAEIPGGGRTLRFNADQYAAFDVYMLEREGAEAEHDPEVLARAKAWFDAATQADKDRLLANIMSGLPGAFDRYDVPGLRAILARYHGITPERLRENYVKFLKAVVPTAEDCGVRLAVHPDDPPRPLFGLPRIVSTIEDIAFILDAVPSDSNGLTLCAGSLGAGKCNDVVAIAERFAGRIHFVHLRNVKKDADGSFMEAEHLGGDTDMVKLVTVLLEEQKRRKDAGRETWRIPFRPDHGFELLVDVGAPAHPGYSTIGRLKGLAEIRGVMTAVAEIRDLPV
ncbi:mannonate hydrolase [uncultured Alphaproteobacteria bacterium]|uniref:Mannonate dehydratase n=1 Tax=uncultured Alphaproteobacteria bacterium TaxID=91750 RepID=A0A212JD89_9PROT|nr:mannonate hydrolase [uncultured Alphaproteobacteria bacterium]